LNDSPASFFYAWNKWLTIGGECGWELVWKGCDGKHWGHGAMVVTRMVAGYPMVAPRSPLGGVGWSVRTTTNNFEKSPMIRKL